MIFLAATQALIQNDAVIFGIIMILLALIFYSTSLQQGFWKKFYGIVPPLLLCYLFPALLNTFNIVNGAESNLYFVASRYLLPASLVLLTLGADLKGVFKLGPKALIMFLTGTLGIVVGGPLALYLGQFIQPDLVTDPSSNDAVWRGMATVAGSWIGGGANQAAMYEIFQPTSGLYSTMITMDVVMANIWLAVLLWGAGRSSWIDRKLKADSSSIEAVKAKIMKFYDEQLRIPKFHEVMVVLGIGFGITGLAHFIGNPVAAFISANSPGLSRLNLDAPFFWMVIIATTGGVILSLTKARNYEGAGASRLGSVFLYVLVATIGLKMDILELFKYPSLFAVGAIWILTHITFLIVVARLIKAPLFFLAVGSQANIGGAASAPIVASAFHPSLAPVGVLLAVVGYALGTYAAWLCAIFLKWISMAL